MKTMHGLIISLLAAGFVMGPMVTTQARAQDDEMFKDVPTTHWAYDDVKRLKADGLLKGYPGGVFIGQRPMTRYEFAAATRAAYEALLRRIGQGGTGNTGDLQSRLSALEAKVASQQGDIDQNKADIAAIKQQLADMASLKDDVARLNRLADTFEKELASLGVDVQNLQADSKKMRAQLDELLKRPVPINIQGDLFLGARGGYSIAGRFGVDLNAGVFGVETSTNGATNNRLSGPEKDLHIVHELGVDFNGNFGNNVRGTATVIVGNYLGYLRGPAGAGAMANHGGVSSTGGLYSGAATDFPFPFRNENQTDVALYRAGINFNVNALGGIDATVGRIGYQVSPFTMMRVDPDYYFDVARYDDGNVYFDGGRLGFGFGSNVKLDIFGGRNNNISATTTQNFQDIKAGNFNNSGDGYFTGGGRPAGIVQGASLINTTIGGHLRAKLSPDANIGATYILYDGTVVTNGNGGPAIPANQFNRTAVYGSDFDIKFGGAIRFKAEYAQSQLYYNGSNRLAHDNWAGSGEVHYEMSDKLNLMAGYKEIRPNFSAPGSWGRIGFWYNPTDIRGYTVGGKYKFGDKFNFALSNEYYEGTGRLRDVANNVVGFGTHDRIDRVLANVTYDFNPQFKLTFDYEGVYWQLRNRTAPITYTGGAPRENYYTLGLGYQLGADALLKFLYQVTDYTSGTAGNFGIGTGGVVVNNPNGSARGGLFVTQLSVKF